MDDLRLQQHRSLSEYFHEVLSSALRNQGVVASEHTEFYLVNLLERFSHAGLSDRPLTLLLAEANWEDPPLRMKKLRLVGDQSLYVTGFFSESLEHKLIDVDYYITLGGAAYTALSRLYSAPPFSEVFRELAQKFADLVDVLTEISAQTPLRSNADLLQLYERYLRTGSSATRKRLRKLGLGILPGAGSGGASA